MNHPLPHSLRSDARDNRLRILQAARAVFGEEGLGAPVRAVARRAEVGPATLYRHFPTKHELTAAAFAEQRRECRAIVHGAGADPDPWRGFRRLVEQTCELHAHSRGFADAFIASRPEGAEFTADREHALRAVTTLARRAQRAGQLRSGFVVDDLVLMLMAHRGVQDVPHPDRLPASRRFAAYVIEAFRAAPAPGAPEPLPAAPRLGPVRSPYGTGP